MTSQLRPVLTTLLIFSIIPLAVGCTALESILINPTPTPFLTDPGPAECFWAIKIVVWGDINGDGVFDDGEPPIQGALLRVAPQGDPESGSVNFTTSAAGEAFFPTRELQNCDHTDHAVLFLRQVSGYEFPAEPVINLNTFQPNTDEIRFGLTPEE